VARYPELLRAGACGTLETYDTCGWALVQTRETPLCDQIIVTADGLLVMFHWEASPGRPRWFGAYTPEGLSVSRWEVGDGNPDSTQGLVLDPDTGGIITDTHTNAGPYEGARGLGVYT
jgi:hypothetical protein